MIQYRLATLNELDFLVQLRIEELALFSDTPFPVENIIHIRNFYENKMKDTSCFTILGYDNTTLVAAGTIYFYDSLPSNTNASGKTGCITNIWTHKQYRHQGIASHIMDQLLDIAKDRCTLVCLNTSDAGEAVYIKKGFVKNKKAMLYTCKETKI